jgi:Melibiase.
MVFADSSNTVPNGSFENGSTSVSNWTMEAGHERSNDKAHAGGYSLKSTTRSIAVSRSSSITVLANTYYKLSGWIYKNNNAGEAYIDMNDISGELQIGAGNGLGGGQWTYVEGTWYSGSTTGIILRCVTAVNPTDDIWFDDIQLKAVLAPNGSFEEGSGASATNWSMENGHARSTDKTHAGSYSLKSTTRSIAVSRSSTITVQPNTDYKLSVWIYKNNSTGEAYVDMNDISGELQIGAGNGIGGGQWTYVEGTWNSGSNNSIILRCVTAVNPTDDIWFDDIQLTPVISFNGSFENGSSTVSSWSMETGHERGSDKAHEGSYSLKSTTRSIAVSRSSSIAVQPNTYYKLSGWIYKNNSVGEAYIDMSDISGELQIGAGNGAGGGQWTYVEGTWNSGSNTSIVLRCVTAVNPTDDIWFDDIQFVIQDIPSNAPSWDINTNDTNLTLAVWNNNLYVKNLKNPTQNWNWTDLYTQFPFVNRIDVGSTKYTPVWTYQGAVVDNSSGTKVTLTFTNSTPSLELHSIWWARPGSGPVEHWMTIENKSGGDVTIYQQESLNIVVKGDINPTLWRFHKDSQWADSTGTYQNTLSNGVSFTSDTNTSNNGNDSGFIPCIYLDAASNHGLYVGLEWPNARINTTATGSNIAYINIKAGLYPDFKTDISNNGVFNVPSVYIGTYKGDTDTGSNLFKKWFFNYKVPSVLRTNTDEPYTQVDDQMYESTHDFEAMGIQSVKWDYGWWSDVSPGNPNLPWTKTLEGDWKLRDSWWINRIQQFGLSPGMASYGTYLHNNNLKWTVYFLLHDGLSYDADALSSIGPNAHPEWFGDRVITVGASADLGNSDCVSWIKTRLLNCLNSYNIDTYRSDFEPISITSNKTNNHKYTSDVQYWCAKGFYEILDYLYTNKTDFRYESCASGGSLKDYATVSRAVVINNNDSSNYKTLRKAFYDSSYCIPSAQLMAPTCPDIFSPQCTQYYDNCGEDQDFGYRSVIMGAISTGSWSQIDSNGDLKFNEEYYLSKYYNMYNQKIKPLVRNANLYHILPRPDDIHWDGMEYYDPNTTNTTMGCVFLFKPSTTEGSNKTVYLKGLDPNTHYKLVFEDRTAQNVNDILGSALMAGGNGLSVNISQDVGSEIIWIELAG